MFNRSLLLSSPLSSPLLSWETRAWYMAASLLGIGICLAACPAPNPNPNPNPNGDAGQGSDAGAQDAGQEDAGHSNDADAGNIDAGNTDAGIIQPFALTSPDLTEGATFALEYTCNDPQTQGRVSLPLIWTPAANAQSYALVMTDLSNNLVHWTLWDIPASVTTAPKNIEHSATPTDPAGSKQTVSYDRRTFGYLGPCPPNVHTYEFAIHALDVAVLPNVSTNSTGAQVKAAVLAHSIENATLTGNYGP